jgi:hypothetical protein
MFSSLPDLQKERAFPHPSRKKKLLKSKRESTRCHGWLFAGVLGAEILLNQAVRTPAPTKRSVQLSGWVYTRL